MKGGRKMDEYKINRLEEIESFLDKFDFNLNGADKCCSWLKIVPEDLKTVKEALAILKRYRDTMYDMSKLKQFKHVIDIDKLMETRKDNII
jgi:hypothetical protein